MLRRAGAGVPQAVTSQDPREKVRLLQMLLHHMQCGNGLMHESVDALNVNRCTRPVFEWANAMLVALFETTLGESCDEAAEKLRLRQASGNLADSTGLLPAGTLPSTINRVGRLVR
jgi:Metal-independent alpha-mannosidase (GH125)